MKPVSRRSRLLIALVVAALTVAAGLLVVVRLHRSGAPAAMFDVVGNRIETGSGRTFIPLGITVFGLAQSEWAARQAQDLDQIAAAATYWHANTIRIQVAPVLLNARVPGYLAALRAEVSAAEQRGLVVILSAQYQRLAKNQAPVTAPNGSTVSFWKTVAASYSSDQRVWFDLFNEPTSDKPYRVWKYGTRGIVGMQELVNTVRAVAPRNIIVAESVHDVDFFQGIRSDVLTGGNIVYAVHPYFRERGGTVVPHTPSWWLNQWRSTWGFFARQHALLIGEWGEYEGYKAECQTNAATLVPAFLSYISSLHLGLIAWALTPGVLTHGANLDDPTVFNRDVPYRCTGRRSPDGQGAGADVRQYFLHDAAFGSHAAQALPAPGRTPGR